MKAILGLLAPAALWLLAGNLSLAQQPTPQERVAALKASAEASKALLKQYEWVETTVVSLKGEEKSRRMERCYYGADGKVQKIPLTTPPPEAKKRGIRGRIAESKKEELTDYMKEAVALVKSYLPLDPAKIQAAKDAGKVSVTPLPDQRVRLSFADYVKPGDTLALEFDLSNNHPLKAQVSTSLSSGDPVTLDVHFDKLDNNASYPAKTVLDAPAKNLTVSVQNSGYRKTSS
jgi:hypothetical protein